jgi:phosphoribosylaminoimidazole-succinocarboxamide synthase
MSSEAVPPSIGEHISSGKVREIYKLDEEHLLIEATNRISVFDVVLPTEIPNKGCVLTGISAFWFARTRDIVPNHMLALRPDGQSMECQRLDMLPIECVVRGYLAGSGWKDYQHSGEIAGHALPSDLMESSRLPLPIFTPSTKAQTGHDKTINRDDGIRLVGKEYFDEMEYVSLALYAAAHEYAYTRGIILADTKFEFGIDPNGALILADELLTPDSSRLWPAEVYRPGQSQPSLDKQPIRDWTEATQWDKKYPGPKLPENIVNLTMRRYINVFERLTDISFNNYLTNPNVIT